jgi:flotillin
MDLITLGIVAGSLLAIAGIAFLVAVTLRRVVPTNEVHIVQSAKSTTSYGKGTGHGNSYFEWPTSIPFLGVSRTIMPTSNFDVDLKAYEAYDEGRLPFVVDVKAFFRIADSNEAAQKVANFDELINQLTAIVQGAVRTILASNSIEEIMQGRSKFGEQFTHEVREQLKNWGVETVKNIELMDIRDAKDSKVIHDIMSKKQSQIESESRVAVAENRRNAELAEISAKQETDLKEQSAREAVGLRTNEQEKAVELAKQEKIQALKEQEKTTKEKEMAVIKISELRKAEIAKEVAVVKSEQDKQVAVIAAEAERSRTEIESAGQLRATQNAAEGVAVTGRAKAEAEQAILAAPVNAQILLAKEIGGNESYQKYLITIEQVKANAQVGMEQAKALQAADVKIISNSGKSTDGLKSVMDVFSSQGGVEIGAMLEGLAATEKGQELIGKFLGGKKTAAADKSPLNGAAEQ